MMGWSLAALTFLASTVAANVKYLCRLPSWPAYNDDAKAKKHVCKVGDLVGTGKWPVCKTTNDHKEKQCKTTGDSRCIVFDCDATPAPTPNPTTAPTPSPTTTGPASPPLPVLVIKKITGVPGPDPVDLGKCEGDCDNDDDCVGELRCFQRIERNMNAAVPGCTGEDDKTLDKEDFCFDQKGYPDYFFISTIKGRQAENLDACQGHCDSDDDCDAQQECRSGAVITGCKGKQVTGYSYCTPVVEATSIITQDFQVFDGKPFDPEEVKKLEGAMKEIAEEITSDPSIETTAKVISQSLCPQNQAICTTRRKLYTSFLKLQNTTTNEVTTELRSTTSGGGNVEGVAVKVVEKISEDTEGLKKTLTEKGVDQLASVEKPVLGSAFPSSQPSLSLSTDPSASPSAPKPSAGPSISFMPSFHPSKDDEIRCCSGFVCGSGGSTTCAEECLDSDGMTPLCCNATATDACLGFTGLVSKDGISCMGDNSCKDASITRVSSSCSVSDSCLNARGSGTVEDSCNGYAACKDATIGDLQTSCNWAHACDDSVVLSATDSCNQWLACGNAKIEDAVSSCTFSEACRDSNIIKIRDSCVAGGSCTGAKIEDAASSCTHHLSCVYAEVSKIENSCTDGNACTYAKIEDMVSSCTNGNACKRAKIVKAKNICASAGNTCENARIEDVESSCNHGFSCKSAELLRVKDSCKNADACSNARIEDVVSSCSNHKSCFDAVLSRVENSCNESASCNEASIQDVASSCGFASSCQFSGLRNVTNSCTGWYSCFGSTIEDAESSCTNARACQQAEVQKATNSCLEWRACQQVLVTDFLEGACGGPQSCYSAVVASIEGTCNGDKACRCSTCDDLADVDGGNVATVCATTPTCDDPDA